MDRPVMYNKDSEHLVSRHFGKLPHWEAVGVATFLTFRLGDSLPAPVLARLKRDGQFAPDPAGSAEDTYKRFGARFRRVDKHLDAHHGCCAFKDRVAASLMAEALKHRDGERYRLWCWCVMPTHVHVVFSLAEEGMLARTVQNWKRFVTVRVNPLMGRSGQLFQSEYFDHLIREGRHFDSICRYVLRNPVAAGLEDWPWKWAEEQVAGGLDGD